MINITKDNTLFIIDWDDTLFPTTWLFKTNMVNNLYFNVTKLKKRLHTLDILLYDTLSILKKFGDIAIVTNASSEWIEQTSKMLPKTRHILQDITIISAKDIYEQTANINIWKIHAFNDFFGNKIYNNTLYNILSLGDANYEHEALDSFNYIKNKKILKSIRFIKSPNIEQIYNQLIVFKQNIEGISIKNSNLNIHLIK